MLAGANRAAVIRADGTAEIIHFQDVTATDAGTFVLSTLLRGRRGTEVYVSLHEPGEMFVMLDETATIGRRLLPLDRVGKDPAWRRWLVGARPGTASPRRSSSPGPTMRSGARSRADQPDLHLHHGDAVLFPIRLDDAVMESKTGWAADIKRTRNIGDFRHWKDHDAYNKAFERLLRDLKVELAT